MPYPLYCTPRVLCAGGCSHGWRRCCCGDELDVPHTAIPHKMIRWLIASQTHALPVCLPYCCPPPYVQNLVRTPQRVQVNGAWVRARDIFLGRTKGFYRSAVAQMREGSYRPVSDAASRHCRKVLPWWPGGAREAEAEPAVAAVAEAEARGGRGDLVGSGSVQLRVL